MEFHHIGMLTLDLDESLRLYVSGFGYKATGPSLKIGESGILACVLERPGSPRVELIQPLKAESTIGRMAGAGTTGYHLAWNVPDLDSACAALAKLGFHALPPFASPLWNGQRCGFCVGPGNELVEFIEQPRQSA